jgi:hypothetical protein
MAVRSVFLVLITLFSLAAPVEAQVRLFSWDDLNFPSNLARWQDPPTGGTIPIGSSDNISFDIAFSPAGTLWGTDGSDVFTIDTTSGNQGPLIPITSHIFGLNEFLTGVTFSPTGVMYGWTLNSTTSGIYTLNAANGTATTVNSNMPQTLFGMTFGPDGTLYASNGSDLYKLNPANGAITQTVGAFPQFITSLGYGPDGILRGLSPNFSGSGTALYRINPLNASIVLLGNSTGDLYGIAAIPSPGVGVILGCGGFMWGMRRRGSR